MTQTASSATTHIVCGHCQAVVRVPSERLHQSPHCPQCHQALLDGKPLDLDAAGFAKQVQRNDLPLIVDVWAPWCGPCKMMAPHFATAAQQMAQQARFAKLNSDAEPQLSSQLGIRSIPTLIVFRQGREMARQAGALDSGRLVQWLRSVLAAPY